MPKIQLPRKMEPILTTKARIIVLIGGRSSGKSEGVGRTVLMKAETEGADILCGREYQSSIDDSVHKLLAGLIEKMGLSGFNVTDKKIDCATGGHIRYKGFARNPESVKSAQDFKYSWVEEAQDLSDKSIQDLLPTIRYANSKLIFTANPQASNDPFSMRFIVPFQKELERDGIYEDDMHLVIKMNWRDNPWHGELEQQRLWDYSNLSRAKYDHIWEGAFNDSVEDSIIEAEWFDAAIDSHIKLGFKPKGAVIASHDPSDSGDARGYAVRHGSVFLGVSERTEGDVNDGCDWATTKAIEDGADVFTWDCDGLGISLKRQVSESLKSKKIDLVMFKGSESPDDKTRAYQPIDNVVAHKERTNEDTFRNKRAQYYWRLRDRFYNTYRAVVKGEYVDPDDLISLSSDIKCLMQLRSEVCRIPRKPNPSGHIQIMTKREMKDRLKIQSPNLADSLMMAMVEPDISKPSVDYRHKPRDFRHSAGSWMR
tara:strand:- start:986 stop:2434 length:1449 start_codon:yes stop_codon:yes gene_type:complete